MSSSKSSAKCSPSPAVSEAGKRVLRLLAKPGHTMERGKYEGWHIYGDGHARYVHGGTVRHLLDRGWLDIEMRRGVRYARIRVGGAS